MQQCFHPSAKHLLYKHVTPSFAVHFFVLMQVKLGKFLHIYHCAFDFCLIPNIFSCRYASRTLRMKLLSLISSIKI